MKTLSIVNENFSANASNSASIGSRYADARYSLLTLVTIVNSTLYATSSNNAGIG
jgi:hypothetical protein